MSAPSPAGPMRSAWMPRSSVAISLNGARGVRSRESKAGRAEHAGVRFEHQHVAGELILVSIAVGQRAQTSVLLVRPQHDAKRAARPQVQLLHEAERFPRHDAPPAVVGRAGADVPGIEVPADDDHFVRSFAAADFADDVERVGVGQEPGLHLQAEATRVPQSCIRCRRSASSVVMAAAGICGTPSV